MKSLKKSIICFLLLLSFFGMFISEVRAADYDFEFRIVQNDTGMSIDMDSPYDFSTGDALSETVSRGSVWNIFLNRYKLLITGFTGVVALSLIGLGMFAMTKLSATATNPQKRQEAIMHILVIFGAATILGAGSIIFGYAYNVFR